MSHILIISCGSRQPIYLCNFAFVKSASAYISRKRKRSFVLKQQQPCMSKYLSSRFNAICTPVYVSMSLDPIRLIRGAAAVAGQAVKVEGVCTTITQLYLSEEA